MDKILDYNSVSISYLRSEVVKDVSFSLAPGEILGIVGESGSGKSTIIKSIIGILGDDLTGIEGSITFNGKDLIVMSKQEMRHLRGREIGMIFQDAAASLCPIRTVGSQVIEALRAHCKIDRKQAKEEALQVFERLNFSDPDKIWKSYPFELSGGMNQRVGILLGMLHNPPLLLADEPTSALDIKSTRQVIDELKGLRDRFGTSIIIVSHDISVISEVADSVMVLKDGRIVEQGTVDEVLNSPKADYTKQLLASVPKAGGEGWLLA